MSTINPASPYAVDLANLKSLSASIKPTKLSEEAIQRLKEAKEAFYKRPVDLENHPSQKTYAEVMVNGKSVAKVYNSGGMSTSNAAYGQISKLGSVAEPGNMTGPELAQLLAEEIAKALGGTVVKSSDAISQSQWLATPPVQFEIDYAAMARDEKAQQDAVEARSGSAKTKVDAQIIGQTTLTAPAQITDEDVALENLEQAEQNEKKDVAAEFLKFAEMSAEEKMRYLMLQQMGVTEEQLAAMAPEQRAKIEQKIKESIEASLKKDSDQQRAA